ncbi:MAG: hypothetical protein JXA99_17175 [Candidatus Lokiarchaeota archaeon]|nr:hypothetical protein [Candidatus Lokiarchaeota archaeon]
MALSSTDSEVNIDDLNKYKSVGKRFFQIDVMKTVCIICVIAAHTFGQFHVYDNLWIFIQPVTLFMIILGFNYGNSFKKKNYHKLSEMYSFQYFKGIFWRLIFPLLLINLISYFIDLFFFSTTGYYINGWSMTQLQPVSWGPTNIPGYANTNIFYFLLGTPYFAGPGDFYIVMLVQFIFIFPLIYKLFDIHPILGLVTCCAIELSLQLIVPNIPPVVGFFNDYFFLTYANILRYMSAIGLGLWFINNHNLFSKKNVFIIVMVIPAFFILVMGYWGDILAPNLLDNNIMQTIFFKSGDGYALKIFSAFGWWEMNNLFTYFWPAFVFLLLMKVLPSNLNKEKPRSESVSRFFEKYSKLTYHILLVQIVYFFINIPIAWGISITINNAFYNGFILPITEPYGISASWMDHSILSLKTSIAVGLLELFVIFINCAVVFTLAIWFRKVDLGIQKNLKKLGKKIKK